MPAGQFAPSKLHIDYGEWTAPAVGSTDTGKAWVWNSATAKYEPAAFEPLGNAAAAVSAHVAESDPHSQYLLSSSYTPVAPGGSTTQVQFNSSGAFAGDSGFTYAGSGVATLTGRLVVPIIRPASDSTTAFRVQNAAGDRDLLTVNTVGNSALVNGDFSVASANGRIWGISGLALGHTVNFQYGGDIYNSIITTYGSYVQVNAYHGIHIRNNYTGSVAQPALTVIGNPGKNIQVWGTATGASTSTTVMVLTSEGMLGIGITLPTAFADIAPATAARASLRIRNGTWPTTPNDGDIANNGNSIAAMVNGTNAVNTDGGLAIWMQSSTTARNVGRLLWQYTDKTDATRVTEGSMTAYYQGTEHKAIRWRGGSAGPLLSFYDVATPIARPTVIGSRGGNAALASLLTSLAAQGLITDSSS